MDPLDMMADELGDDASETGSLLGVKKRSRVKNSWFDDEAGEDIGEVGEQGDDEDDENTTGRTRRYEHIYLTSSPRLFGETLSTLKHIIRFFAQLYLCVLCSDLGKIKAELAGPMGLDIDGNPIQDDAKSETTETNIRPVVVQQPQTVQQRPFQPGSTPVHLMHRFMVRFITKKSCQSTWSKPVDNMQQACYHQAGASDAHAS